MAVHVALLRGINVGGKNKLPMKALVAVFAAEGCTTITTYIQSGNVVFEAPTGRSAKLPIRTAAQLPARLAARIQAEHGLTVPVIVRTAAELAAVARGNPLLAAGAAADTLYVMFLADRPSAKQIASLDPDRSPPDAFVVQGREIYLCCPAGVARTKLTNAYFDRALATVSTARNWRTVGKLVELSTRG